MAHCPICRTKKTIQQYRPFCSKRCADVDLAKWLNNSYVIQETADEEEEIPDPELLRAASHKANDDTQNH